MHIMVLLCLALFFVAFCSICNKIRIRAIIIIIAVAVAVVVAVAVAITVTTTMCSFFVHVLNDCESAKYQRNKQSIKPSAIN